MRFLYEPVAVRRANKASLARSRNSGTRHWRYPRRRDACAESKYLGNAKNALFTSASAGLRVKNSKNKEKTNMKTTFAKRLLSFILCLVLIAAVALFTIGCDDNATEGSTESGSNGAAKEATVIGEGEFQFFFTVVDADGNETKFDVRTDKAKVGEALQELELISGEMGDYGLYVKTVNGITVDYDKDGKYWAFYINGEYGMNGVDLTDITNGTTYSFKVE